VGYERSGDSVQLRSFGDLLSNDWLAWQYLHNMGGAAITGAFVLAAMGAYYLLNDRQVRFARTSLSIGVVAAFVLCLLQIFPTGDGQAKHVAKYQPSTFAAMEGVFESERGAPLVFIGNPNTETRKLESTIGFPDALSFMTYKR